MSYLSFVAARSRRVRRVGERFWGSPRSGRLSRRQGAGLSRACVLAAGLLLFGAVVALSGTAHAQKLVSNLGQRVVKGVSLGTHDFSQRFTTGTSAASFRIARIRVEFAIGVGETVTVPTVRLFTGSGNGTKVADFTGPSAARFNRTTHNRETHSFIPTAPLTLAPGTDYYVTIEDDGVAATQHASLILTRDEEEDAGGAPGWTIADRVRQREHGTTGNFSRYSEEGIPQVTFAARIRVDGVNNIPATGEPEISGDPRVGRVLTAARGSVADRNGMPHPNTFEYQWFRVVGGNSTEIPGATGKTYRLTAAEQGHQVRVRLSFTDNDGFDEMRTSGPYPAPGNVGTRPANIPATGEPEIPGDAQVGRILTAGQGDVADRNGMPHPDTFEYQWFRVDGGTPTEIAGATGKTYRLTANEQGHQVRVRLSFTDNDGYDEARTSNPYPTGANVGAQATNIPATGTPTISGEARVGRVLTAAQGTVDDDNGMPEPDSFMYQWFRVDGGTPTEIPGATGKTYRVQPADEGMKFTVKLSFTDNDGFDEMRDSDPAYPTENAVAGQTANIPATGKPTISGTVRVGEVLTADRGDVADANGMPDVFEYQWFWVDGETETEIPGATAQTYRLGRADEDRKFRVRLSFVDNDGHPEARTSDPYPPDTAVGRVAAQDSDAVANLWLARFARTVATQAMDAVEARLAAPGGPGFAGSVAGQSVGGLGDAAPAESVPALAGRWDGAGDGPALRSRTVPGREALAATAFAFNRDGADGGGAALWGRGTVMRFEGRQLGATFDGEVTNAMLGAEGSWGPARAGLMLSLAEGHGGYSTATRSGDAEARLATVFPYARYALSERIALWGMAGYGVGSMTLKPETRPSQRPDIDFAMLAAGARGVLVEGDRLPTVTAKTDAMAVRARSDRVPELAETEAEVTRLRLALEGEQRFALGGAAVLTPSLSLGLRRDGGDADTGTGADIGAGIALSAPASGLSAAVRARALLTHEAKGYREHGLAGELSWDTAPEDESGLSLSLAHALGGPAEDGADALLARPTLAGLGPDDGDGGLARRRFEVRLGYGIAVWGARWTAKPELGLGLSDDRRELRLGGRLIERAATGLAVTLAVDGARRERLDDPAGSEREVGLAVGWRLAAPRDRAVAFEMRIEADRRRVTDRDVPPETAIGLAVAARW